MTTLDKINKQYRQTLVDHLQETFTIDESMNLITITDDATFKQFKKMNGNFQCNGDNLTEAIATSIFNGEAWFLYINIGMFGRRFCYNAEGVIMKYVDSENRWYDAEDEDMMGIDPDEVSEFKYEEFKGNYVTTN